MSPISSPMPPQNQFQLPHKLRKSFILPSYPRIKKKAYYDSRARAFFPIKSQLSVICPYAPGPNRSNLKLWLLLLLLFRQAGEILLGPQQVRCCWVRPVAKLPPPPSSSWLSCTLEAFLGKWDASKMLPGPGVNDLAGEFISAWTNSGRINRADDDGTPRWVDWTERAEETENFGGPIRWMGAANHHYWGDLGWGL